MKKIRILVLSIVVCASITLTAEEETLNPENVMVGRFIFERPSEWKWIGSESDTDRKGSQLEVKFEVEDDNDAQETRVFINLFEKNQPTAKASATISRWKSWFQNPIVTLPLTRAVSFGRSKVSYTEISGTYKHGSAIPARPHHKLFGSIIEDPKGSIIVRLVGPAHAVEKAKPKLKKMIEEALDPDRA